MDKRRTTGIGIWNLSNGNRKADFSPSSNYRSVRNEGFYMIARSTEIAAIRIYPMYFDDFDIVDMTNH